MFGEQIISFEKEEITCEDWKIVKNQIIGDKIMRQRYFANGAVPLLLNEIQSKSSGFTFAQFQKRNSLVLPLGSPIKESIQEELLGEEDANSDEKPFESGSDFEFSPMKSMISDYMSHDPIRIERFKHMLSILI